MSLFSHASFYTSVNSLDCLPCTGAEVAFVGRSNAGKSSAINALANRNRLSFVSKLPGRTQFINFFSLGREQYLVDLPGYGFANVSASTRHHWLNLLARYLETRKSLVGLLLITDIRHPLKDSDLQMLLFSSNRNLPVHILLSKSDKLSRLEQLKSLNAVRKKLGEYDFMHSYSLQLFSSLKKQGIGEVESVVKNWFLSPSI